MVFVMMPVATAVFATSINTETVGMRIIYAAAETLYGNGFESRVVPRSTASFVLEKLLDRKGDVWTKRALKEVQAKV